MLLVSGCIQNNVSVPTNLKDCGVIDVNASDEENSSKELCVKEVMSSCSGKFVIKSEEDFSNSLIELSFNGLVFKSCVFRAVIKSEEKVLAIVNCNFPSDSLGELVFDDPSKFFKSMSSDYCEKITDPKEIQKIYSEVIKEKEDSQNQIVGELIPGSMSKEEIASFFNNLKTVSNIINNDYFSKENNYLIMKSIIYSQFGLEQSKMKITSITPSEGGITINSDSYLIYKNDSQGNLVEIVSYKTCMDNPLGGSKICVDLATLGEDVSKLTSEQNLASKEVWIDSVISYLGEKDILGIKSKCFKMNYSNSSTSNNCYHPEYSIILESDISEGSLVRATDLKIGDINPSEFE